MACWSGKHTTVMGATVRDPPDGVYLRGDEIARCSELICSRQISPPGDAPGGHSDAMTGPGQAADIAIEQFTTQLHRRRVLQLGQEVDDAVANRPGPRQSRFERSL